MPRPTTRRDWLDGAWIASAWIGGACLVLAGVLKVALVALRGMLLAPLDGESLMMALVGVAAVIGVAWAVRLVISLGRRGREPAAAWLGFLVLMSIVPMSVLILFIHGPRDCTVLTMPDGSREWAVCEFAPLAMHFTYTLHRGNGFVYNENPAATFPVGADGRLDGRYVFEQTPDGGTVLRYATEYDGPMDGSVVLPR